MIAVAGSLNMDLVGRVPHLPAAGETVLGTTFARHPGGKGGNQAVAIARLGRPVRLFGALGSDGFGDELIKGLHRERVDASGVRRVDGPSGCALISVSDDGENAISVLPGANSLAPLPPQTWPLELRWLLLQLEIPLETTLAWAQAAHAAGVPVLLNAAPMTALPTELLPRVDTLLVNRLELGALVEGPAGRTGGELDDNDLQAALVQVTSRGPHRVVATLGSRGCLAWDGERFHEQPARAIWMVDSTGAGDTFAGALACGLAEGRTFGHALARANVAAALSCTRLGARAGMPTRNELEQTLAE